MKKKPDLPYDVWFHIVCFVLPKYCRWDDDLYCSLKQVSKMFATICERRVDTHVWEATPLFFEHLKLTSFDSIISKDHYAHIYNSVYARLQMHSPTKDLTEELHVLLLRLMRIEVLRRSPKYRRIVAHVFRALDLRLMLRGWPSLLTTFNRFAQTRGC